MNNDLTLLNHMISDLENVENERYLSRYWKSYSKRIQKGIKKFGLQTFRSNYLIGKGFCDIVRNDPFLSKHENFNENLRGKLGALLTRSFPINTLVFEPHQTLLSAHIRNYLNLKSELINLKHGKKLEQFFHENESFDTLVGCPSDIFFYKGKEVGASYLSPILTKDMVFDEFNKNNYNSLIEIGGGFGANAHTLINSVPKLRKYIYMDLPPMLYVGTQYLKHFFGDDVIDYNQTSKLKSIKFEKNDALEIFCITPWQLNNVDEKIDFLFNAHSFQEIDIDITRDYASSLNEIMNKKNSVILQFYEHHPDLQDIVDPSEVIDLLNENCNFRILKKPKDVEIGFKSYLVSNFKTD